MDKYDIVPGVPYARAIMEGLEECPAFVVLLSSNSIESDDVLNEIDQAHAYKKLLIPVFLESDLKLPQDFSYYLKRRQWIYLNGSLEKCIDEICEALSSNLGLKFDDSESRDNVVANGSGQCYLLKIKPNEDCMVLVDGDDMGIAEHEKTTKFELRPGEYEVICRCIKTNEEIELDGIVISDKDLLCKPEFKKEGNKKVIPSMWDTWASAIKEAERLTPFFNKHNPKHIKLKRILPLEIPFTINKGIIAVFKRDPSELRYYCYKDTVVCPESFSKRDLDNNIREFSDKENLKIFIFDDRYTMSIDHQSCNYCNEWYFENKYGLNKV